MKLYCEVTKDNSDILEYILKAKNIHYIIINDVDVLRFNFRTEDTDTLKSIEKIIEGLEELGGLPFGYRYERFKDTAPKSRFRVIE